MLTIDFQHDFQHKVMTQTFADNSVISDIATIREWRKLWMAQLSSWHTPYKALIDCQHLSLADKQEIKTEMLTMLGFFQKLFLRKVVGINYQVRKNHDLLPFPLFATFTEGQEALGVRMSPRSANNDDLRSQVVIQNHFRQQVVEIYFSKPFVLDSNEKLAILKSKLTNNLMQWHSRWSLLIECSNFSIIDEYKDKFKELETFFHRYFLQKIVGYNIKQAAENFPFPAYRSKHKAAVELESSDSISGDEAHCRSKPSL